MCRQHTVVAYLHLFMTLEISSLGAYSSGVSSSFFMKPAVLTSAEVTVGDGWVRWGFVVKEKRGLSSSTLCWWINLSLASLHHQSLTPLLCLSPPPPPVCCPQLLPWPFPESVCDASLTSFTLLTYQSIKVFKNLNLNNKSLNETLNTTEMLKMLKINTITKTSRRVFIIFNLKKASVMMTNLPLSRPTPQTRILAIGWEWSTLRSMGSTRFNILFSSSRYMSFPWTNTHTQILQISLQKHAILIFSEAQGAKKVVIWKVKCFLFFNLPIKCIFLCVHISVCVSVCVCVLNKLSNLKRGSGRWKVIEKGMKLSLSLCSVASH